MSCSTDSCTRKGNRTTPILERFHHECSAVYCKKSITIRVKKSSDYPETGGETSNQSRDRLTRFEPLGNLAFRKTWQRQNKPEFICLRPKPKDGWEASCLFPWGNPITHSFSSFLFVAYSKTSFTCHCLPRPNTEILSLLFWSKNETVSQNHGCRIFISSDIVLGDSANRCETPEHLV